MGREMRLLNDIIIEFISRSGDRDRYEDRRKRHTVATECVRLCCSPPPPLQQWVNRIITGWSV